ncbi:hypothetical protein SFA35_18620 [Pseudomonas sp. HR96]|uniref:hypothetical protein n=1 Tax=Pseudomonas sp. HR96 TaxID=1027966 RepID=UPI002A75A289|nr:hypothetical protein [Pseudomonas sp. HR96]WPO98634.1 hypothetical protein SFA35_18620 [Pseudomonas sp. HR96]
MTIESDGVLPFVLDDRSLEQRLEEWRGYVDKVPFEVELDSSENLGVVPLAAGLAGEMQTIESPRNELSSRFGAEMKISADGQALLVGTMMVPNTVYFYRRDPAGWKRTHYFYESVSLLGSGLAVNADGSVVALGSPLSSNGEGQPTGKVFIYRCVDNEWETETTLELPPGGTPEEFGNSGRLSLSADGTTLVDAQPSLGLVHVYSRNDNWQRRTLGTDQSGSSKFGAALSLSADGSVLVVGEPQAVQEGIGVAGAVHIFERSGQTWEPEPVRRTTLYAPTPRVGDQFGTAVKLSGPGHHLLIRGNSGVHVYHWAELWSTKTSILASTFPGGDGFGSDLAISDDGTYVLIGLPQSDLTGNNAGAVYSVRLFKDEVIGRRIILPPSPWPGSLFGTQVCMSGDSETVAVSAPYAMKSNGTANGVVYVYSNFPYTHSWSEAFFGAQGRTERPVTPTSLQQFYDHGLTDEAPDLLPHQALMLAYWRMMETPRWLLNRLPRNHRQLYYRKQLGLKEKPAQPDQVIVSFIPQADVQQVLIPAGTLLDGGRNETGSVREYRLQEAVLANHAQWTDLRWVRFNPDAENVRALVAYDLMANVPWPPEGMRLFANDQPQYQRTSSILVSSALTSATGIGLITVGFGQDVEPAEIAAAVSSNGQWVDVSVTSTQSSRTLNLAPDAPLHASPPAGLDGFNDAHPLLRLSNLAGKNLQLVDSIAVTGPEPDSAAPPSTSGEINAAPEKVYYPTPFSGWASPAAAAALHWPQPAEGKNAYLYLGFNNAAARQTLSLCWRLQSPQSYLIEWSYLATGDVWKGLAGAVNDRTQGLFLSGLWTAQLPADATLDSRVMPTGRIWLRAAISGLQPAEPDSDINLYPLICGLTANAGLAIRNFDNPQAASDFAGSTPANSVRDTLEPIEGLASVTQPWPSQGGRAAETTDAFIERCAARLANRGRGLTAQEIVGLLLAQFTDVAQIIAAKAPLIVDDGVRELTMVVIPAHGAQDNQDPLRPVFSPSHLAQMTEWLVGRTSPWLQVRLINPVYVDTRVTMDIVFATDINHDYALQQVQTALARHYMPWAFDDTSTVRNGGPLDYYALLALILRQPDVVRVTRLVIPAVGEDLDEHSGVIPILTFSAE